ncbi:1-phosphofructokinase family hexose kinase [Salinarimonas chemoclinalis]|uniref:1-phosphofructokinase family hexose kinase n=1 Tax=Salinarimonas chemoclinalis TaxID=3241599 RepID=UPI003558E46D
MKPILTLTLNPSVDGSAEADTVRHTHKIRTSNERYDPGGGGINVARVLVELGAEACAVYAAGGATGGVLDTLVAQRGIAFTRIPIHDDTRISHVVFERSSGKEYRFVPEGPLLREGECAAVLAEIEGRDVDWIVASGSLPRGTPPGFYARIADIAAAKGAKLVLDTSGAALADTLAHGGIHLVKPSQGELEKAIGRPLADAEAIGAAAMEFVAAGKVDLVAVTLGHEGAILASREGVVREEVPRVEVRSAVGAGDSFVAGMTFGLATGLSPREAFVLGMAAGTAAVLTPGTELCKRADVARLRAEIGA